jgi:4-amino-4-deoxy-L-arabinose transferase-like glycosyltransferase
MLPLALLGLLAVALAIARFPAGQEPGPDSRSGRRDPRLAGLLVLGSWFAIETAVLSFSKGIVHPYYISALGPGAAAMAGAGALAFARFGAVRDWRLLLAPIAVAGTVIVQITLLRRAHYMPWFEPVLIACATVAVLGLAIRRVSGIATALLLGALSLAPGVYAATTWQAPVQGTFPAAGPRQAAGTGGLGVTAASLRTNRALLTYVKTHRPGSRWAVLADASDTTAPLILLGLRAGSLGGYSGTDPALDGPGLARLVARGEARYVVLGGAYASRGGNLATAAVGRACTRLPTRVWLPSHPKDGFLILFDCAGRERRLAQT